MSDDATLYFGYTVNTVALCSLGCCYGHRVVRTWHARDEPQVLAHATERGFANVWTTLDPYHWSFMPNEEITQLARDIVDSLRGDWLQSRTDSKAPDAELVQQVLDKVETVGGFDLSTYEVDEDDDDDDEENEDGFTKEELDDRWDEDDDEDDDEDEENAP